MRRRTVLDRLSKLVLACIGVATAPTELLAARRPSRRWQVRRVRPDDERDLVTLMRACVADPSAFHGQCRALEWTSTWARETLTRHPASMTVTVDGTVVGFLELPTKKPRNPSAAVERHQQAFWCGAGGVRADLLAPDDALRVFRHLIYRTFIEARRQGYEYVRCAAPWEHHPSLPRPFADYPGLELTSFTTDQGELRYLIEWRLRDAIDALAAEGAAGALERG